MSICKTQEVLKQVIVRKPGHKLQIKITVDISTYALKWVKFIVVKHKKIRIKNNSDTRNQDFNYKNKAAFVGKGGGGIIVRLDFKDIQIFCYQL